MPGWKHHPYTITCARCGKTRKARSPNRRYCSLRCKVAAAEGRRATRQGTSVDAVSTDVEVIKQEVSGDESRRQQSGERATPETPEGGGSESPAGGGVRERPSPAEDVQDEVTSTGVGRTEDTQRAGLSRSPVSGLLYVPDGGTDEAACIDCGDVYWGVDEPYRCNRCYEGAMDD